MTSKDLRYYDERYPVCRMEFAQKSWVTDEGHAAKTDTLNEINMLIERIDILISEVTGNPTVTVTITDHNSVQLVSFAALADGTKHIKLATSDATDFDALPVSGDLTVSIDPSADPGGVAQTLTVDVIIYGR